MILDTSGPISEKPFAYYDRDSRSWRMLQDTAGTGSDESLGTVPRAGFMRDGFLYELPTSVPRTSVSDCSSLLPTPTGNNAKNKDSPSQARRNTPPLTSVSVLFPTPNGSDASGSRSPKRGTEAKIQIGLPNVVKLLPTPRTTDANGGGAR